MKLVFNYLFSQFLIVMLLFSFNANAQGIQWAAGYLDIHHINSGSGNSTFMVFPDGTTLLFDAGDIK